MHVRDWHCRCSSSTLLANRGVLFRVAVPVQGHMKIFLWEVLNSSRIVSTPVDSVSESYRFGKLPFRKVLFGVLRFELRRSKLQLDLRYARSSRSMVKAREK